MMRCVCAVPRYEAQGNEFSYFMLLASSFVLNHLEQRKRGVWLGPPQATAAKVVGMLYDNCGGSEGLRSWGWCVTGKAPGLHV